jgi:DNA-binding response OmpR family regulator
MEKILIIEDDRAIQKALRRAFETEGFALDFASDGASGLEAFRAAPPVLVVLDLKLPKVHGRDVCRTIKTEAASMPIIILSASADEVDKVLLLELGADDYVTKPFSPKELLARVHAVLRRARGPKVADQYAFDDVAVDFAKMELTRKGELVPLTPQEFKVLKYFIGNPERVISRDELLNEVWGYNCYPSTRTVDNHLMKLRQKLEADPLNPFHFKTVHGAGYKFVP